MTYGQLIFPLLPVVLLRAPSWTLLRPGLPESGRGTLQAKWERTA
ncbi:Uncharacterised protein [Mycobacteroides abscessus subsp. abscessus]|nr:Uncharacterised protein [Mycobacteroides abscessus subsp. abscessus]